MRNFKKVMAVAMIVVMSLSMVVLTGCGGGSDDGKCKAKLTLVLEDKSTVDYDLSFTEGASLRAALFESELISEETNGAMFVEDIDGHIANVEEDGCTWLPKDDDGKQIMGTFDDITLEDGQHITLEYFKVPDMD